jgi:uncharacterized protein YdeI (YjbR/CyaY-like superfamily)
MIPTEGFAQVEVRSATELRDWLLTHHGQAESVWLVTWKKKPGAPYVSVAEVLDELIAFGWIDGIRRKLDDDRTMQLISARRQQVWAKTYKDRAARLLADGRMMPSGMAAIAASQRDGLWDAMADVDALIVPLDLETALAARPPADAWFAAAAPSYRRNVLRWIKTTKTAQTREKRISMAVDYSGRGEKIPQM